MQFSLKGLEDRGSVLANLYDIRQKEGRPEAAFANV
jgi:hypothetical protein